MWLSTIICVLLPTLGFIRPFSAYLQTKAVGDYTCTRAEYIESQEGE